MTHVELNRLRLASDLPTDVIQELCLYLNPPLLGKDYKSLAGKMEVSYLVVKNLAIGERANPTESLLNHWFASDDNRTVKDLIYLVDRIERHDVRKLLERYTYIEEVKVKRHGSSDLSANYTSDDEQSGSSLPYAIAPSFRTNRSNPSDTSTVCADEDCDTDEELNMKLNEKINGPSESYDTSYEDALHPSYQFRHGMRRESSTSNSTTSSAGVRKSTQSSDSSRPPSLNSPPEGDLAPSFLQPQLPSNTSINPSDKVALVIGNQNYLQFSKEEPRLHYPHRDVYDFTKALQEMGFRVLSLVDLTLTEMRTIMIAFCKMLGPGVFAVFYFAGHGFEENGENYLMPIDASMQRKSNEFICAQEIINEMQLRETALNLLIIDACRIRGVNTDGENKSLPLKKCQVGNTIVAYSCQSQMPAFESYHQVNGVYMTELLKKIKEDKRIEHILLDVITAVHGNPYVIQRPVIETDAKDDCRLTSQIFPQRQHEKWQEMADTWVKAGTPPREVFIQKDEEKIDFLFSFKPHFSNLLDIEFQVKNRNSQPIIIDRIQLDTCEGIKIQNQSVCSSAAERSIDFAVCHRFRLSELQKVNTSLLLVLTMKIDLHETNVSHIIDLKFDIGYPLIAGYLDNFRSWIKADNIPGYLGKKNTWV